MPVYFALKSSKLNNTFVFHISASNLINSIDPKADPCKVIFQFACGKWREKQVIPEYASITGVTHKLNDEFDIIVKREIA